MKLNSNFLLFLAWTLITISLFLFCTYHIIYNFNSCTADPFSYGVQRLNETIANVKVIHGTVTVVDIEGNILTEKFGDEFKFFNFTNP
jgi:hypothetical protein